MTDRVQWVKDTLAIQIFFVSLPGWFLAAILYIVLSRVYQRRGVPVLAKKEMGPAAAEA